MSEDNNEQGRRARDMKALLHFCTELTAAEDTTVPSNISCLDPERREFLEKVFGEMQINVGKLLKDCLRSLLSDSVLLPEADIYEQEGVLDQLADYAVDLNYSTDLLKIGGFPVIIKCLSSPHCSLRSKAASLIGDICQNQIALQKEMLSLEVLPMLLDMVDADPNENCRVAAFFGLSCLVRNCEEGEALFMDKDGLSYLMRAIQSGVLKLCIKAIFLLNQLIEEDKHNDVLVAMGFVEQLVSIVSSEVAVSITKEHCINSLLNLVSKHPAGLKESRRPELHLATYLTDRLTQIEGKEEFLEEEEYIKKLQEIIDSCNHSEDVTLR